MKKLAIVVGAVLGVLIASAAILFYLTFGSAQKPTVSPPLGERISQVLDGFSSIFLIDLGNQKLAMVDAGNDPKGTKLLAAIRQRGKSPEDIVAIFLTHAHPDHIATLGLFPSATVYVSKPEVPVAEGIQKLESPVAKLVGALNKHPFKVGHPLQDGEKITLGDTMITAYTIAGHTPGSTAYLIDGALFLGDAANFRSNGRLDGPWWIASDDSKQGLQSLKRLAVRLVSEKVEVKYLVTAHTGAVEGIGSLLALAGT